MFVSNSSQRHGTTNGGGGAIVVNAGDINVLNSTFYGNYSEFGGAAIANSGAITLTNCTLAGNNSKNPGSAISTNSARPVVVRNTIISDNGITACYGANITDGGGNLRWPAEDSSCPGAAANPQLQVLADNGSSQTLTMAIGFGSAALRLATTNCPAADQRGLPRGWLPGRCDSGAYEFQGLFNYFSLVMSSKSPTASSLRPANSINRP